jgi:hypothetical protein
MVSPFWVFRSHSTGSVTSIFSSSEARVPTAAEASRERDKRRCCILKEIEANGEARVYKVGRVL